MNQEEEQPTAEQIAIFEESTKGGTFCPFCESEGGQHMVIENAGETNVQIYCAYCRQFHFIN